MACLQDIPTVIRSIGSRALVRRVWNETMDDHLPLFAAALAYAWLFAVFPFFIFLLTLVKALPGSDGAKIANESYDFIRALLPDKAGDAIWEVLKQPIQSPSPRPGLTMLVSLSVTLWAASGGVAVTMAALDKCYELDQVRAYYKRRPMAMGLTAIVSLLTLAVILLLPIGLMFQNWMVEQHMETVSFWLIWTFGILRGSLAVIAALLMLAVLYHWGPGVKQRWRAVTPGSVFCVIAWVVLGLAFKFYVNQFGGSRYEQTYGAAWWVWILLVIFYLDALVLLIGAEINSEIDFEVLKVKRGGRDFRATEKGRANEAPAEVPLNKGAGMR